MQSPTQNQQEQHFILAHCMTTRQSRQKGTCMNWVSQNKEQYISAHSMTTRQGRWNDCVAIFISAKYDIWLPHLHMIFTSRKEEMTRERHPHVPDRTQGCETNISLCINKETTIVREFSIGKIFRPLNFRVALFSSLWPLDHKALLSWARLRVNAAIVRLTQVSVALRELAGTASSTHRSCWFLFGGRVKPTSLFHR